MKKIAHILIILILIGMNSSILSQPSTHARVENIDFELINNKLIINYDIVNFNKGDKFYVWIEIFNSKDHEIIPRYVTGDVNLVVAGGRNKNIIWNIFKDQPEFNDEIYVKVSAIKYFSYERLLLLSAIYPGLGNYKINKKKISWLIGGVAYGSLISSVIWEQIARTNYNNYKNELIPAERDELYDKAINRRNLSNALLIASSGIWIGRIGYTLWEKSKYDKNLKKPYHPRFVIAYSTDPLMANVPLLSAKIMF